MRSLRGSQLDNHHPVVSKRIVSLTLVKPRIFFRISLRDLRHLDAGQGELRSPFHCFPHRKSHLRKSALLSGVAMLLPSSKERDTAFCLPGDAHDRLAEEST